MTKNIIFVGGIHGVGKTTACQAIASNLGILHFSSSVLISEFLQQSFSSDKLTDNISDNQDVLVEAVREHVKKMCLLDGHFCLLNKKQEITRVPLITFQKLPLKAITVLKDNSESIKTRLVSRDQAEVDIKFIERFQKEEVAIAKKVSEHLEIPCAVYSPIHDMELLMNYVEDQVKV